MMRLRHDRRRRRRRHGMRSRALLLPDAHPADELVVPLDVMLEALASGEGLTARVALERLHLEKVVKTCTSQKILIPFPYH